MPKITIDVDHEIYSEFLLQLQNWINDFYGDESSKISMIEEDSTDQ